MKVIIRLLNGRWLGYRAEEVDDKDQAAVFDLSDYPGGCVLPPGSTVYPYITPQDLENQSDAQVQLRLQGI